MLFAPTAAYAAIRKLAGIPAPRDERSVPGAFVATGSRDKSIRIWTQQGQCLRTLNGHDNWVRGLAFAPDGRHLLSVSDDKTLRVWDLATGRCVKTVDAHAHFATCIAWGRSSVEVSGASRSVNVAATGSVDLTAKVWAP